MNKTRIIREDINLLKGFAILAVVLYHMGWLSSGYLGVDAFFVINGFFIVPKVISDIENGQFRYFTFLGNRVLRLLPLLLETANVWGIGTKNFGESNGIIYKHRNQMDYLDYTIRINPFFFEINKKLETEWKDYYIDLLGIISNGDGTVPVFSNDHRFLSQDCQHFTRGGASFYAEKINFEQIFK